MLAGPCRLVLRILVSLTAMTTSALAAPVVLRLAKPADGDWEVRSPTGERACQLPCDVPLEDSKGWSVQRLEDDERIELPDLARFAADTTLDAKVRPKAGSVLGGA